VWSVDDNPLLGQKARDFMQSASGGAFVSIVTIWEIAIKFALRRERRSDLKFSGYEAIEKFEASGFDSLQIEALHAAAVGSLPHFHADPFDRLLVAQALVEGMTLLTHDSKLAAYGDFVVVV
jgi:PIN domain nuclease of toxin-antitoxin system